MDWFVKAFIRASLAWFAAGVSLGLAMTVHPAWAVYRTAHLHMNLLGFVSMMIFGVAYHVIPRFSGNPLQSPRLAVAHWWLANVGLATFVVGLVLLPTTMFATPARVVVATGGLLSTAGAYTFVYNLWRTTGPRRKREAARVDVAPAPSVIGLRRAAGR
jgi:cbb3-type cytochrome oxidase subunit 1